MKRRHTPFLVLTLLAGAVSVGTAYKLNGPKWGVQEVPYYINPVNPHMPEADAIAAIQAGAMAWAAQSNANVSPYYVGRTSGSTLSFNGKNEVFFREGSNGNLYGETLWWYSGTSLLEADVVFYSTHRLFSGDSGCSSGIYLQDATTHEFGHALGLGHSAVTTASMYPTMGWCSTSVRTLDSDDVGGIEALYGGAGSSNSAPQVTISAPTNSSSFAEGASIGFWGSASDDRDGDVSYKLTWASNLDGQIGTGPSFQRVLSAGTHTITVRATDSAGLTGEIRLSLTVVAAALPPPEPVGFALWASGYKVKGHQKVNLTWSGATGSSVDVFRNGVRLGTIVNSGNYTDAVNVKGKGNYTYVMCETGTSTCSNQVNVSF